MTLIVLVDHIVPNIGKIKLEKLTTLNLQKFYNSDNPVMFPSPVTGKMYGPDCVGRLHKTLMKKAGLTENVTLHGLRHTFAVHTLQKWVERGEDLTAMLPVLSVFMGHKSMQATSRYLRLTAEVYPEVIRQVEDTCAYVIPGGDAN